MPTDTRQVTLLLPAGLSPDRYHALTRRLVHGFSPRPSAEAAPAAGTSQDYLVLSQAPCSAPADMPVLNDSTWTLSMPVPADTDLDALAAAAKRLPDGGGIQVEAPARYRTSHRDP